MVNLLFWPFWPLWSAKWIPWIAHAQYHPAAYFKEPPPPAITL